MSGSRKADCEWGGKGRLGTEAEKRARAEEALERRAGGGAQRLSGESPVPGWQRRAQREDDSADSVKQGPGAPTPRRVGQG